MPNQQGREEGSEQGPESGWQGPVSRWSKASSSCLNRKESGSEVWPRTMKLAGRQGTCTELTRIVPSLFILG